MESRYRHKPPVSAEKRATTSAAAPLSGPRTARFLDESETAYLVGEPRGPQQAWVPKQRAAEESFLLEHRHRSADVWLLRWSAYAVLGVACGGVVGVLLGGLVVVAALVRSGRGRPGAAGDPTRRSRVPGARRAPVSSCEFL